MQQQSLNIEHLKKVTKVYCHGHCPDGLASAMIIDKALFDLGFGITPTHIGSYPASKSPS